MYDVLFFHPYFCDLIITGLPELPRLGLDLFGTEMSLEAGGTFNTVRALHRLGEKVGWVCNFGNDLFSQFVLSEINKEGVDTSLFRLHEHPVRVFSLSFSYHNDRGFISYMDPPEWFDRLPYVYHYQPRAVMLCSLEYGPETLALVDTAHTAGARVLMDCQATGVNLDTPGLVDSLRAVDVFLPNASEARQLTGAATAEQAAEILAEITPLVVVKMGPDGALAYGQEEQSYSPALPVQVVDTTGAGDCFNAGFLHGYLQDWPLERSLLAGNICGGLSTTAHGTVSTPTLQQLIECLSRA